MSNSSAVTHDPAAGRFEIATDAGPAVLTYFPRGDVLEIVHTEVPEAAEGRGFASALARAALDHARSSGKQVIPSCPYVAAYIRRHPAYADLVAR